MKYTTPITDRTQNDIDNASDKGHFNIADWERIYYNAQNINALAELLLGVTINFDVIPVPVMSDIPDPVDFNTLLSNINAIRTGAGLESVTELSVLKADWAAGFSTVSPDFEDVNEWELTLEILIRVIAALVKYNVYCGVASVGQIRFYQHRWRAWNWVPDSVTPVRRARLNVATCGASILRNNLFRRYD